MPAPAASSCATTWRKEAPRRRRAAIEQAVGIVHAHEDAEVRVIIRPRKGNFDYSKAEMKAMETDIRYAGATAWTAS